MTDGILFVVAVAVTLAITVLIVHFNNRVGRQRPPRFGDPGIGQRDDYDSDIKSPEITAMRNAQRASDIKKAWDILKERT